LTPELREAGHKTGGVFTDFPAGNRWHRILHSQGWIAPSWPEQYGGTGWSAMQRFIFAEECARAHAPRMFIMGIRMVGPVLMRFGTEAQKQKYLPRILSGDDVWCQGYSEPGSGSDLASLKMRAERQGDCYVLNGTKIWTTYAQHATRMFCLVRTGAEGKPQDGISFVLIEDMKTPGITVKPIITLAGDHEVNQVFFAMCACRSPIWSARKTRAGRSPNICSSSSAAGTPIRPACTRPWNGCSRWPARSAPMAAAG